MSLAPYPATIIGGRRFQLSDTPSHAANSLAQLTHDHIPPAHWQPCFAKSSNVITSQLAQRDSGSPSWRPPAASWIQHNSICSSIHHGADNVSRQSQSLSSPQGQYPESSQRTILPSPSQPFTPTLSNSPSLEQKPSYPPSQGRSNKARDSALYAMNDANSMKETSPGSDGTSSPPVKMEADDDCFIMEFSDPSSSQSTDEYCLAPPTEVPLRATQASEEMRKMMGVFRLNPFAMHNAGGRGITAPTWDGEEAGPLTEEPQLHEFQVELQGTELDSEEELRSFSPDFEIGIEHEERKHTPSNSTPSNNCGMLQLSPRMWDRRSGVDAYLSPTGTSASLDLEYPGSPDHKQQVSFQYRYPVPGYATTYHGLSVPNSPYASSSSSNEMIHVRHRDTPHEQPWSSDDYIPISRAGDYIGSSELGMACGTNAPAHSTASNLHSVHYLPTGALSIAAARRWSLPSNPQATFLQ